MNNSKDNLTPCDRCGKISVKFYAHLVDEDECYWHFSHYCSAINGDIHSGMFDTEQEAIDAWNERIDRQEQS